MKQMEVVDPGHGYMLNVLDDPLIRRAPLAFVKRMGDKYPENNSAYGGTTMQEVLRVLIDRCEYVKKRIPCWQTRAARKLMMFCVWLFEERAARRHGRRPPSIMEAVFGETCPSCGHVG
jgi:hypothetical protein